MLELWPPLLAQLLSLPVPAVVTRTPGGGAAVLSCYRQSGQYIYNLHVHIHKHVHIHIYVQIHIHIICCYILLYIYMYMIRVYLFIL